VKKSVLYNCSSVSPFCCLDQGSLSICAASFSKRELIDDEDDAVLIAPVLRIDRMLAFLVNFVVLRELLRLLGHVLDDRATVLTGLRGVEWVFDDL